MTNLTLDLNKTIERWDFSKELNTTILERPLFSACDIYFFDIFKSIYSVLFLMNMFFLFLSWLKPIVVRNKKTILTPPRYNHPAPVCTSLALSYSIP